jgi:hypothetical protein
MFHINENDFHKIIKSKSYELVENPEFEKGRLSWKNGNCFYDAPSPDNISWFQISQIKNPVVYIRDEQGVCEYIIYDKSNNVVYYHYLSV